jgi:hypothetical protein
LADRQQHAVELWQQLYPEKPNAMTEKEAIFFRVTGDRFGKSMTHSFSSMDIAKYFGAGVQNQMLWKGTRSLKPGSLQTAKMKSYDIEIIISVYNTQLWAGIVLREYDTPVC